MFPPERGSRPGSPAPKVSDHTERQKNKNGAFQLCGLPSPSASNVSLNTLPTFHVASLSMGKMTIHTNDLTSTNRCPAIPDSTSLIDCHRYPVRLSIDFVRFLGEQQRFRIMWCPTPLTRESLQQRAASRMEPHDVQYPSGM